MSDLRGKGCGATGRWVDRACRCHADGLAAGPPLRAVHSHARRVDPYAFAGAWPLARSVDTVADIEAEPPEAHRRRRTGCTYAANSRRRNYGASGIVKSTVASVDVRSTAADCVT